MFCLPTNNQPDTPLPFKPLNTRFGYSSLTLGWAFNLRQFEVGSFFWNNFLIWGYLGWGVGHNKKELTRKENCNGKTPPPNLPDPGANPNLYSSNVTRGEGSNQELHSPVFTARIAKALGFALQSGPDIPAGNPDESSVDNKPSTRRIQ